MRPEIVETKHEHGCYNFACLFGPVCGRQSDSRMEAADLPQWAVVLFSEVVR